jgi:hypothetical protein
LPGGCEVYLLSRPHLCFWATWLGPEPSIIKNTNQYYIGLLCTAKTIHFSTYPPTILYLRKTLPCTLVEEGSSNWSVFLVLGSVFHSAPSKTNPASILSGI